MPDELLNAWGEPVEPEDSTEPYWVPEDERTDDDSDDPEGNSNALDADTGDDITGVEVPGRDTEPLSTAFFGVGSVLGSSEEE